MSTDLGAPTAAQPVAQPETGSQDLPVALPRPEVTPAEPFAVPVPIRHRLDNGLTVLSYDMPGQYIHSLRLAIPVPVHQEPVDKEGVATIMARTLDEGTARHTALEFARLLERRGVALGAGVGESGLSMDIDVAKRHLDYALDLLRQCLTEPAFPQDQVERHVATRLAEIEQERSVAGHRAAAEFWSTYFDPTARASRPVGGRAETVATVTRDDVVAFHARHIAPDQATLVIAGDFGGIDVIDSITRALGGWTAASAYQAPPPRPSAEVASDRARIVVVDRPESVQTEILVGCPGPDRRVAGGWAPYPLLGFLLGGAPTSRLDALLREDKGYTYGVRASFRPRRRDGVFHTSGSVRADATVDALRLLLGVLDDAREGFTAEEVQHGVRYLTLTAPGRYATADAVADEAAALAYDGLTTEFTGHTLRELAGMDAERVGTAYRRFVDGQWTVVLVGDAAGFIDEIRELGRGAVTVVPT